MGLTLHPEFGITQPQTSPNKNMTAEQAENFMQALEAYIDTKISDAVDDIGRDDSMVGMGSMKRLEKLREEMKNALTESSRWEETKKTLNRD